VTPEETQALSELRNALQELLNLSNHYARLLNEYDAGERMTFNSVEDWVARLKKLKEPHQL
jgi:hypothetical protein